MSASHSMSIEDAYKLFINHILTNLHGKKASNGWYNIRGDSFCSNCATHTRSALYILAKEGTPPAMNCFRAGCGERGVMNASDFIRIGFDNEEATKVILRESSKISKGSVTRSDSVQTPLVRNVELSTYQKQVLRDRCRFTNQEIRDAVSLYRIIPNLTKTIDDNYNDVDIRKRFDYLRLAAVSGELVSFATKDFNTFSVRSEKLKGMISIKESIFTGYTLMSQSVNAIETLVVTEGVFDILNIKRFYCNIDNALYVATLGFANMYNLIKRYYCKHIGSVKTLIIFADSDVSHGNSYTYDKRMYTNLLRKLTKDLGDNAFQEIYIVYNKASKDFGDFRQEIVPQKIQIK